MKMEQIDFLRAKKIIEQMANTIIEHEEELCQYDSIIGDSDHGTNMARGFREVLRQLSYWKKEDVDSLLKMVGNVLVSKIGGAMGPLLGLLFMKLGEAGKDKKVIDLDALAGMFEYALKGVKKFGKVDIGEKTIIDSLQPAVMALKEAAQNKLSLVEGLKRAAQAAEEGMLLTESMIAKKGRARFLGEKSISYRDPGATSIYLLFQAMFIGITTERGD